MCLSVWSCRSPPSAGAPAKVDVGPGDPNSLRGVEAFAPITDAKDRSAALFTETTKVFLHPRCVNCHPNGDSPLQDAGHVHDPPVARGKDDRGVPGLLCTSCHQDKNLELARVPGAPNWHLAPRSMAWQGKSPRELCEQLLDPARNGGRTHEQLIEHVSHDALVAWGWSPGHERALAPGTQEQFGKLVAAWLESGAACPEGAVR